MTDELMSETASGLLRVVVLIGATSMFAIVWRGDQQAQQQFILARKAAAQQARQIILADLQETVAVALTERPPHLSDPVSEWHDGPALPAERSFSIARVEVEMTLPEGIASGRYHVIDPLGQIQAIRVHSNVTAAHGRDIYLLDLPDGARRVFVRMSLSDEPKSTGVPDIQR